MNTVPTPRIRYLAAKRVITYFLTLILLVLLLLVVRKSLWLSRMNDPPAHPPAITQENTFEQLPRTGLDLGRIISDPTASAQSLPPGAKPLDREPADLPVPPNSQILLRYQISDTSTAQHICVRSLPDTTIESAASFYRQALRSAGLSFQESIPAPLVLRLTAEQSDRSLMIRLRQAGSEVRLVVQLRYTIPSDS